ncbi:MAG: type II toxin-antitoxin system Phd/YefM family antitoxin [Dehalococcoidia bacterium]|nr:type II toxin-antitoxin system Phd/YefM family antitoxin [Dehalococcoidia bacterium]
MKIVGVYEARTHLSALLDEVANGATIEVTRNGKPVAHLVPAPDRTRQAKQEAMDKLRRLRVQPDWPKFTRDEIVDLIREGREERDQQIERALGWRE